MLKKSTFDFLVKISFNNSKKWIDEYRSDYDNTMEDFKIFNQKLIEGISNFDKSILESKLLANNCIPRLNRDIRFTKDKSPYKTYLYSIINEGGRKSSNSGYFLVINPDECYLGAGAFQPDGERLKKIRNKIQKNVTDWNNIVTNTNLLEAFPNGIVAQESLKKVPIGFQSDSQVKDFLKMKGFFVRNYHPDVYFRKEENFEDIMKSFEASKILNDFLNKF